MSVNNELMIPPQILNAIYKQERHLKNNPISGIIFHFNESDITDIQADIEGPSATPYEGGIFRVMIKIPQNFPVVAPKGIFLTKIFHPNISEQGEICVNTLKRDWDPKNWSLSNLFQVIKCLLIIPFPQSALNEEAGKLFMEDYDQFFKTAQMMTSIHAKSNKNKINNIKNKKEKDDFSSDSDDNNKYKNDIYRTPVKKKRKRDFYETDSTEKKRNISFNHLDFSSGNKNGKFYSENKNINNINFKNNCKLDMYSLCSIRKNISVSDSKNKKEEIDKWIKRI
jgi:ubiquitin-conjugating enzyme E2 S